MLPSNLVSLFYLTLYLVNLDMVNCATSGLGDYRCYQSNYSVGVTDKDLESDSVHRRVLESNSGNIIDYQMTTGTLPRTEVVNAVLAAKRGEQNFELLSTTGATLFFQDLTRDDMVLYAESGDLTKAFVVEGAFLQDTPEMKYQVTCPAEGGKICQVEAQNGNRNVNSSDGLVDCFSPESNVVIFKENIPAMCLDVVYEMNLAVVPTPHFFLLGVKQDADENKDCPPSIMMNSISGQKKMVAVFMEDMAHLPMLAMGTASLANILEAEENAQAINDSVYDVWKNNCVHYAVSILRPLGLTEGDLDNFLIEHIVNDDNSVRYVKNTGGARALAAVTIGGKSALNKYFTKMVHSELGTVLEKRGGLRV